MQLIPSYLLSSVPSIGNVVFPGECHDGNMRRIRVALQLSLFRHPQISAWNPSILLKTPLVKDGTAPFEVFHLFCGKALSIQETRTYYYCTVQVGAGQISVSQGGIVQFCTAEVGASKVGLHQHGAIQMGATEVCAAKVSIPHKTAVQICTAEVASGA